MDTLAVATDMDTGAATLVAIDPAVGAMNGTADGGAELWIRASCAWSCSA